MKSLIFVVFFFAIACAPKSENESPAAVPTTPAPAPEATSSIWCGKLIVSTLGTAIEYDLTSGAAVVLVDGVYDFPAVCNAWGGCTIECKFEIKGGEPRAAQ